MSWHGPFRPWGIGLPNAGLYRLTVCSQNSPAATLEAHKAEFMYHQEAIYCITMSSMMTILVQKV